MTHLEKNKLKNSKPKKNKIDGKREDMEEEEAGAVEEAEVGITIEIDKEVIGIDTIIEDIETMTEIEIGTMDTIETEIKTIKIIETTTKEIVKMIMIMMTTTIKLIDTRIGELEGIINKITKTTIIEEITTIITETTAITTAITITTEIKTNIIIIITTIETKAIEEIIEEIIGNSQTIVITNKTKAKDK